MLSPLTTYLDHISISNTFESVLIQGYFLFTANNSHRVSANSRGYFFPNYKHTWCLEYRPHHSFHTCFLVIFGSQAVLVLHLLPPPRTRGYLKPVNATLASPLVRSYTLPNTLREPNSVKRLNAADVIRFLSTTLLSLNVQGLYPRSWGSCLFWKS